MEKSIRLYSLRLFEVRTWLFAAIFIAGNIALPQLCHLMPQGGLIFLPIYFFTLIAAYKYGLTVGLLTAVLSPLANHLLFGMPPTGMLAPVFIKSVLFAFAAAGAAKYYGKVTLPAVFMAVIAYQVIGTVTEWLVWGDFMKAVQDFRIGIPGMLVQIFGGYLVLKAIEKV